MTQNRDLLTALLREDEESILGEWLTVSGASASQDNFKAKRAEAKGLLDSLRAAVENNADGASLNGEAWAAMRSGLEDLSRSRAEQGQSAGDTSAFVLALKGPLFAALSKRSKGQDKGLLDAVTSLSADVDRMAQWTVTTYQRAREDIISRQQQELLELSTPVIKLWDGVLAVPMIGTLDSNRTQLVMEALLQRIVETESGLAIIDITGVPTVDTLVAQHLLKTVTAIRLMGADCIISGIRPQIAQTIVHLGIDLQGVTTKATLADALALALKRTGYVVTKPGKA
ncbi:MAG: STAS domain-containing protein [Comamonadaceae bacterium]|nr:MAG: STAS domain-containing protein [Comamonadaceae bacterium]